MTLRSSRRTRVGVALSTALTLASGIGVPAASAGAIDAAGSKVADSAVLSAGGRSLQLRGIVRCTACKAFTLGATVSQGSSGAVGQGGVRCACQGAAERWILTARAREATTFRVGAARVCVWVTARGTDGKAVDARQWCESVRLTIAGA